MLNAYHIIKLERATTVGEECDEVLPVCDIGNFPFTWMEIFEANISIEEEEFIPHCLGSLPFIKGL